MLCRKAGADEAAITAWIEEGAAEASERQPAKAARPGQAMTAAARLEAVARGALSSTRLAAAFPLRALRPGRTGVAGRRVTWLPDRGTIRADSGTASARRPCGGSCAPGGGDRSRGGWTRLGGHSCARRPKACWPVAESAALVLGCVIQNRKLCVYGVVPPGVAREKPEGRAQLCWSGCR